MNFTTVGDPKNYPHSRALYPSTNPIQFLRENYPSVEVVAQSALDMGEYNLDFYQSIVLYGHDEYWTQRIKSGIESAVAEGVNLINLSGNTGYRKLVRTGSVIGFDSPTPEVSSTSEWGAMPGDTNALKLLGVQYLGEPFNKRSRVHPKVTLKLYKKLIADGLPSKLSRKQVSGALRGMMVRDSTRPIFQGTGLKNGEFFGISTDVTAIEVDGVPEDQHGNVEPNFTAKFGAAPLSVGADTWLNGRVDGQRISWRAGQLVETKFGKGKVFSAGPIGWTLALVAGDKCVARITQNVVKLFNQE